MEYFEKNIPFFFYFLHFGKKFLVEKILMKIGDYQQKILTKFGYRAYVKVFKKVILLHFGHHVVEI